MTWLWHSAICSNKEPSYFGKHTTSQYTNHIVTVAPTHACIVLITARAGYVLPSPPHTPIVGYKLTLILTNSMSLSSMSN